MGFVVGGTAFVLAGLLVWQDAAGIATLMARSRQGLTRPMRRLTSQELRVSPRTIRLERYFDGGLLTVIGVLMLWAGFAQ